MCLSRNAKMPEQCQCELSVSPSSRCPLRVPCESWACDLAARESVHPPYLSCLCGSLLFAASPGRVLDRMVGFRRHISVCSLWVVCVLIRWCLGHLGHRVSSTRINERLARCCRCLPSRRARPFRASPQATIGRNMVAADSPLAPKGRLPLRARRVSEDDLHSVRPASAVFCVCSVSFKACQRANVLATVACLLARDVRAINHVIGLASSGSPSPDGCVCDTFSGV